MQGTVSSMTRADSRRPKISTNPWCVSRSVSATGPWPRWTPAPMCTSPTASPSSVCCWRMHLSWRATSWAELWSLPMWLHQCWTQQWLSTHSGTNTTHDKEAWFIFYKGMWVPSNKVWRTEWNLNQTWRTLQIGTMKDWPGGLQIRPKVDNDEIQVQKKYIMYWQDVQIGSCTNAMGAKYKIQLNLERKHWHVTLTTDLFLLNHLNLKKSGHEPLVW